MYLGHADSDSVEHAKPKLISIAVKNHNKISNFINLKPAKGKHMNTQLINTKHQKKVIEKCNLTQVNAKFAFNLSYKKIAVSSTLWFAAIAASLP